MQSLYSKLSILKDDESFFQIVEKTVQLNKFKKN